MKFKTVNIQDLKPGDIVKYQHKLFLLLKIEFYGVGWCRFKSLELSHKSWANELDINRAFNIFGYKNARDSVDRICRYD